MTEAQKAKRRKDVTAPLFTTKEIVDAIIESMGSVVRAAKLLGVDRTTIYNYKVAHPEVAKALEESRAGYKVTCQEFARDNHLTELMDGQRAATAYELEKMEPKPVGVNIDVTKLSDKELATLRMLLEKAKPDGLEESSI